MAYNNYGNNNGYNRGGYNKGNGGYNSGNQGGYNQNNTNSGNGKSNKIGAIWRRQTKNGMEYLSISINGKNYSAFINNYKQNPNQPDFNIVESTVQSGTQTTTTQNNQSSGYNKGTGYGGGYQKQAQAKTQVDTDAYYAAQNMPLPRGEFPKNEFDDSVGDINALPGNDMPVF